MRPLLSILAAAGLTLAAPAVASAGTVTTESSCPAGGSPCTLVAHFVAAPGETNDVRVNVGAQIRISDENAPIVLQTTACTREHERAVVCPADEFDVRLGDGNDRFGHNPPYPLAPRIRYQPTVAFGEEGDDVLVGYQTADRLDGGPGADFIRAHDGDDTVIGGPGDDHLEGMEGDDAIDVADAGAPLGADFVDGGPGKDLLDYSSEQRPLVVALAAGAGGGAATRDLIRGIENLRGGAGSDQLEGDGGINAIDAGPGGGGISGRGGDDVLTGGAGADTLDGGAGNDSMSADVAAGTGASPDDFLFGGPGDDVLTTATGGVADGGDGADRVTVAIAPARPLRVRCGAGEDAASVERRVTLRSDCEWLSFGDRRIEVHRQLRLLGRSARARVRGFVDAGGVPEASGRLVLRHAGTGRILAAARWRSRFTTPSMLVFRPRLSRTIVRRVRGGRPLAVTVQDAGSARGRATLTR